MKHFHTFIMGLAFLMSAGGFTGNQENKPAQLCRTRHPLSFNPQPGNPNKLSSYVPHNVDFVQLQNGYSTLTAECQTTFDYYSWQLFVALNWPAYSNGKPMPSFTSSNSAPRVWEFYTDPKDVFNPSHTKKLQLLTNAHGRDVLTMMFKNDLPDTVNGYLQALPQDPLIDRNLNFVMYEVKVNKDWVNYVTKNNLNTISGQQKFVDKGKPVMFTAGFYSDTTHNAGGIVGAMEIKAAWKILDTTKGDNPNRYYTKQVVIYMDSSHTTTGKPLIINVLVGLVGFHVNHYTDTKGNDGLWTTFEQVDNAPATPVSPTDTIQYSFYNAGCTDCPVNTPPSLIDSQKVYKWSPNPPYASAYAYNGKYGTQVERTDSIFYATEKVNAIWRAKLKGTIWANYKLIGTQWLNAEDSRPGDILGIPPQLTNTVLETYIQGKPIGSCMNCHGFATGAVKKLNSDLSFLLGHATRK